MEERRGASYPEVICTFVFLCLHLSQAFGVLFTFLESSRSFSAVVEDGDPVAEICDRWYAKLCSPAVNILCGGGVE